MLQDLIPFPSCHKVDTGLNELSDHRRIAVLSIETNQSCLWSESEVPQVGCDGLERRSQFTAIILLTAGVK